MAGIPYIHIDAVNRAGDPARCTAQLADALQAAAFLEDGLCRSATYRQRWTDLESLTSGLYEEMAGLVARGPDVPLTEHELGQVNRVIGLAGQLMRDDPFFGPFAPSFSPKRPVPPYREVVCVLRQVLQALARCDQRLSARQALLDERMCEARTVSTALVIQRETSAGYVLCRDVRRRGVDPHPAWFLDFEHSLSQFNFQKLNETLLESYFRAGL